MLHITELAQQKVQEFIAGTGKPDMVLRIRVTGKNEKGPTFGFALEESGAERPGDKVLRDFPFHIRIDGASLRPLQGATVDWVTQDDGSGFSVKRPEAPVLSAADMDFKQHIIDALRTIFDPEIPVNIYDLGLIYDIIIDAQRAVVIRMTLTTPNCPAAESLPAEVKEKVAAVTGVTSCEIDLTWDPPWDKDMMSEEAKLQLGL